MKQLKKLAVAVVALFILSAFTACQSLYYPTSDEEYAYDNPDWAPPYYSGVRYYYIPDIESYYDLSTRTFIYLDNGVWSYSRMIPSIYAGFNLYDCFTIALNINVFQPWMHHQYYISHYPRYYYRDYYDRSNIPYVRGYNENNRRAFFWKDNERSRAREWNDDNIKSGRKFKYSKDDRQYQIPERQGEKSSRSTQQGTSINRDRQQQNIQQQQRTRENENVNRQQQQQRTRENENVNRQQQQQQQQQRTRENENVNRQQQQQQQQRTRKDENVSTQQQSNRSEATKETQSTNYYGKNIGQPVKVEPQMRRRSENVSGSSNSSNRNDTRSNTNSESRSNSRRR